MTIEIRIARPAEYAAVGDLTAKAYTADGLLHPDSDYAETLRDARSRGEQAELWVAVEDDGVIGTVTFCPPGSPYRELAGAGEGEFRMLAVGAQARRRGVAEALVTRCLSRSRELGDHRVVICSQSDMHAAHRIYARLGFVRLPEFDWQPLPGIELLAFAVDLATGHTVFGNAVLT